MSHDHDHDHDHEHDEAPEPRHVERGGILSTDMGADGSQAALLSMPGGGSKYPPSHSSIDQRLHFLQMNGADLFKDALAQVKARLN